MAVRSKRQYSAIWNAIHDFERAQASRRKFEAEISECWVGYDKSLEEQWSEIVRLGSNVNRQITREVNRQVKEKS